MAVTALRKAAQRVNRLFFLSFPFTYLRIGTQEESRSKTLQVSLSSFLTKGSDIIFDQSHIRLSANPKLFKSA